MKDTTFLSARSLYECLQRDACSVNLKTSEQIICRRYVSSACLEYFKIGCDELKRLFRPNKLRVFLSKEQLCPDLPFEDVFQRI